MSPSAGMPAAMAVAVTNSVLFTLNRWTGCVAESRQPKSATPLARSPTR